MDGGGSPGLGQRGNKSETFADAGRCGFIIAGAGLAARFCDRPVRRGSYCAEHAARCRVRRGTSAAARAEAELAREAQRAMLMRDVAEALAVPEPLETTERDEVAGELDLPARGAAP
jgi:hypothetical protein